MLFWKGIAVCSEQNSSQGALRGCAIFYFMKEIVEIILDPGKKNISHTVTKLNSHIYLER